VREWEKVNKALQNVSVELDNLKLKILVEEKLNSPDSAPCSMCGEPVLLADIHCGRCKSKNISYWFADEQYECLNCNFIWKK